MLAHPVAQAEEDLDALLTRVEAAHAEMHQLSAAIRLEREDALFGEVTSRFGTLIWQAAAADQPSKARLSFHARLADGVHSPIDEQLIYDGAHALHLDGTDKVATRYALSSTTGDPLRDGTLEGIALPIPVRKDELQARFRITNETGEDSNDIILALSPTTPNLAPVTLVLAKDTLLPVRIITQQGQEDPEEVRLFVSRHDTQSTPEPDTFDTTPPTEADWQVQLREAR